MNSSVGAHRCSLYSSYMYNTILAPDSSVGKESVRQTKSQGFEPIFKKDPFLCDQSMPPTSISNGDSASHLKGWVNTGCVTQEHG